MNKIELSQIIIDPAIQLKARHIDDYTVGSYVEAVTNGVKFPPIVLFDDGQSLWLADGFHRVSAYRFLNLPQIEADVRTGTRQDALVFAATANVSNGRPMSQAEKREAGERLIKLTGWSDVEIARRLAISHQTVMRWRQSSCPNGQDTPRTVTRNGTTYTMDTGSIGKQNGKAMESTAQTIPFDTRPLFADDPELQAALEDEQLPVCQECGQVYEGSACPDCFKCDKIIPVEFPQSVQLLHGDIFEICNGLQPDSVDVIITDPPYPKEYLDLYGKLAQAAERILKPGGSLLAMCGQSYLPDVFNLMTPHLNYHWTLSYQTPGGQSPQIWPRKVNTFWKPVLWFVKGEYNGQWHGDVIKSDVNDNDKRFHEWGQSESGMMRLVNDHSLPGDLILDPFLGGGTTGLVAVILNRRFIGIDIDKQAIETSKNRIMELLREGCKDGR